MGTFVSMTLVHASKAEAEEAMGLAFQEIDRLTSLMNRFEESGPVGFLNKEGFIRDMPPHR
jgi:thiamine biosynthesis lipoprotein